ncbi:hypothetical protein ACVLD2_000705 [Paenibacillus sp. PvR052]
MIKSQKQSDFMLVYLPDNDHEVQLKNPAHAEEAHVKILELLLVYSPWEEALKQNIFIIIK